MSTHTILQLLSDFVAIPSVSAQPERRDAMYEAQSFLSTKLKALGFDVQSFRSTSAPALLVASRIHDPHAPTIGIYGHYDVQPEDPIEEWHTVPFTLTIKDGKLLGRGVADNKGHIIQNIAAVESLISSSRLRNNIMFVLEGEEETGSMHFEAYIQQAQKLLEEVDVFYVTDMGMHGLNKPQIFYALRGICFFELTVRTGERDLHSGVYGNRVYNPAQVIIGLISKMKDEKTDKILLPGFYDKVRTIEHSELTALQKTAVDDTALMREANVFAVRSSHKEPAYLRAKIHPSLDVNGMWSGYTGSGSKTIIPASATVKFSIRLVEHQDPKDVEKQVDDFIRTHLPKGVRYELKTYASAAPFYTDYRNTYVKKTADILEETFSHAVLFNRSGGTVGAAEVLQRVFQKPVILTGFTLPDDNIHSPNENFDEAMFWKGIEALEKVYSATF